MNLKYLLSLFLLILCLSGFGQITAPADFHEATEYSDSDYVFVFCTDVTDAGKLIANDSTGFGGYNFEWFKFNESVKDFTDILSDFIINNDSTYSVISGLKNGGYKVILTNADTIQEYIAWVYNNTHLSIELQKDGESDCDYLGLWGTPNFNTDFTYYNIATGTSYDLQNKSQKYYWNANPELERLVDSSTYYFTSIPNGYFPLEDTKFKIVVKDRFGCLAEDEIDYVAIETDAELSWTIVDDKTGIDGDSGSSGTSISAPAPLMVRFKNESLNGYKYTWFFGDTLWNNDIDTVRTDDFLLQPEHTYYYTVVDSGKTYTLRLYSESEYGCKDSIFLNIKVEPSKIKFPNVFTPNGDDFNNVFIVKEDDFQSIRNFKITIFNRVGQVVHEFEGDIRDWTGWDGSVKGRGDAPAGNYFFVVEATGWDDVNYNNNNFGTSKEEGDSKKSQFGVVRLFR